MKILINAEEFKQFPSLRFPHFTDNWKQEKLGEILKVERGGSPRPIEKFITHDNNGIPWIKIGDLKSGSRFVVDTEEKIKPEGVKKSREVHPGDFILSNSMSFGRPYIVKIHGCIHDGWLALRNVEKNKVTDDFLYVLLQTETIRRKFLSLAAGSAVKNLKSQTVQNTIINIPTVKEQQEIALFLISIDDWIENLQKQKKILENYKKGMIQKIFSQTLHFKKIDGTNFPDWENKMIGDIFNFLPTNSYSRDKLTYDLISVKNIHYGDIHTQFSQGFKVEYEKVPYLNSSIDIALLKQESYCIEGDVVLADASEDYKDIGKAIEILSIKNQKLVAGLHTLHLRKKEEIVLVKGFSNYLFQSDFVRGQLMKLATGISVLGISKSSLSKVMVSLPHEDEQLKIVTVLSSIDELIGLKHLKIKLAKQWRKGLMQQMFV
jgi:type I restriction enzyme S subunit